MKYLSKTKPKIYLLTFFIAQAAFSFNNTKAMDKVGDSSSASGSSREELTQKLVIDSTPEGSEGFKCFASQITQLIDKDTTENKEKTFWWIEDQINKFNIEELEEASKSCAQEHKELKRMIGIMRENPISCLKLGPSLNLLSCYSAALHKIDQKYQTLLMGHIKQSETEAKQFVSTLLLSDQYKTLDFYHSISKSICTYNPLTLKLIAIFSLEKKAESDLENTQTLSVSFTELVENEGVICKQNNILDLGIILAVLQHKILDLKVFDQTDKSPINESDLLRILNTQCEELSSKALIQCWLERGFGSSSKALEQIIFGTLHRDTCVMVYKTFNDHRLSYIKSWLDHKLDTLTHSTKKKEKSPSPSSKSRRTSKPGTKRLFRRNSSTEIKSPRDSSKGSKEKIHSDFKAKDRVQQLAEERSQELFNTFKSEACFYLKEKLLALQETKLQPIDEGNGSTQ